MLHVILTTLLFLPAPDPTIARAAALAFPDNPPLVEVVGVERFKHLPRVKELSAFRLWKGGKVHGPIYVNRHSAVYQDALAHPKDYMATLLLAGRLVHEHAHAYTLSEKVANTVEAEFLRKRMNGLSNHQLHAVTRYVWILLERAKEAQ